MTVSPHFLQEKAFRGEALNMIRRAIRDRWPLSLENRERLRTGLEDLLSSGTLKPRQAASAAKLLADLAGFQGAGT